MDATEAPGPRSGGDVRRPVPARAHFANARHRAFGRAIATGDAVAAALAALLVVLLAWRVAGVPSSAATAVLVLVLAVGGSAVLWLCLLALARAYEVRYLGHGSSEGSRVVMSGVTLLALTAVVGWAVLPASLDAVVVGGVMLTVLLSVVFRSVLRAQLHKANLRGETYHRVLLVGESVEVARLTRRMHRNRYHGWHVVGSAGPVPQETPDLDSPVRVGAADTIEDVLVAARHCQADLVLLAPSGGSHLTAVDELERALHVEGREVALAPPLVEAVGPRVAVEPVCGLPVLHLSPPELGGPRRAVKRAMDHAASGSAVLVLLPVLLLLAVMIRLDSHGPALFRQQRVGRNGAPFTIYKFRTMFVDAEERLAALAEANDGAGPLFKMRSDPRITRVGRMLRRTSLDELPQLLNVLLGTMSLVGPRPPLPAEVAQYDPVTRRRMLVRPGITGLWQIHGRSDLSWEESTRLDVRYVENWSLGFDLSILVRTIRAVVQARGAY